MVAYAPKTTPAISQSTGSRPAPLVTGRARRTPRAAAVPLITRSAEGAGSEADGLNSTSASAPAAGWRTASWPVLPARPARKAPPSAGDPSSGNPILLVALISMPNPDPRVVQPYRHRECAAAAKRSSASRSPDDPIYPEYEDCFE